MQADRAQDYIIGQLTGDVLGRRVQFQPQEKICRNYPDGLQELADGGTRNITAGPISSTS